MSINCTPAALNQEGNKIKLTILTETSATSVSSSKVDGQIQICLHSLFCDNDNVHVNEKGHRKASFLIRKISTATPKGLKSVTTTCALVKKKSFLTSKELYKVGG